jgi:hypothetical protein
MTIAAVRFRDHRPRKGAEGTLLLCRSSGRARPPNVHHLRQSSHEIQRVLADPIARLDCSRVAAGRPPTFELRVGRIEFP